MNRREFVRLMGLASSASLLSSCGLERETEKLIPYLVPPDDGVVPGVSVHFNTTCTECPAGCGVSAKVMDRRAAKLEGIETHPVNEGALCIRGQASISTLYHPDRLRHPFIKDGQGDFQQTTWDNAYSIITDALKNASGDKTGSGVDPKPRKHVFLSGRTTGTFSEAVDSFCKETGVERLPEFEFYPYSAIREANRILFGRAQVPSYRIDEADLVLSIGADLFETFVNPVSFAAQFGRSKKRSSFGWIHLEPHVSLTGLQAKERHTIAPGGEIYLLSHLLREVSKVNVAGDRHIAGMAELLPDLLPRGFAEKTGLGVETLDALSRRLIRARRPLVIAGGVSTMQPSGLDVAVLTGLLQWATGMLGGTVRFEEAVDYDRVGSFRDVEQLEQRLESGDIGVLFLCRVDPFGTTAGGSGSHTLVKLKDNFEKATLRIGMGEFMTKTLEMCDVVLPLSHTLESWGDARPRGDILSVVQPAVEPIHDTRSDGDVLIQLTRAYQGAATALSYQEFLIGRLKVRHGSATIEKLLSEGFVKRRVEPLTVTLDRDALTHHLRRIIYDDSHVKPVLVVAPSIRFFDGRSRGLPLLSEIPDPLTTVSYGGWVSISEATAEELTVKDTDEVTVSVSGWKTALPVKIQKGLPRGVMMIQWASHDDTPFDFDRMSGEMMTIYEGAAIAKTGRSVAIPALSGSLTPEGRKVIPYLGEEDQHHHGESEGHPTFYPKHEHKDYRWGMVIDLDLCIGCSACAAACYIENNIPVVGAKLHLDGREMSWIRIEPVYAEEGDNVEFLPMLCQHCENAPCETVCPVYATYHNPEGLNAQVYNRCVGTRYCSNNCPYKVRRFNWFDFKRPDDKNATVNPEVSIRGKGVMEKCTFCIQRIRGARDTAKDEKRKIKDGEVIPACAQTCPTNAIHFGNLEDETTEVGRLAKSERAFQALGFLGTDPGVYYLRGVWKKVHG
ncbi:MAG: 4Fe-4S dicluster domain-containing protein [Candidatus Latescibacterota bacterium]|nr:MAG: 4Fe-4S dicluster domain-containing protein [Candidatus Latescibacterota bacterium]